VQAVADGFVRDLRALSDAYETGPGSYGIRVCTESEWYTWALTGAAPKSMEVSSSTTWLE
jgi:hypothetical protein